MKKLALYSIILFVTGIGFALVSGAQVMTPAEKAKSPELQNDTSKCVRIAVVNSQRAFEMSTEGKKFLAIANKLSKNKQQEEVAKIRTEMVAIIKKIAEEKGYGLVLDLGTSGIVCWFPPVDDLTDELVEKYNSPKH